MKLWGLLATVVLGCGGSSHQADRVRDPEEARIEAMKPTPPYEVHSVRGYKSPTSCGQGPYRLEAAALGAHFGENFEVKICAPISLEGDYAFTKGTERGEPKHFGSRNNSEHCVPTAEEAAAHHGVASTGGPAPATETHGASASSVAASASTSLIPVEVASSLADSCPDGMYLSGILDFTYESAHDTAPWEPGFKLALDVWSDVPLDLDGALFIVIQRGVRANMTEQAWTDYRAQYDHWVDVWNAYLRGEVTAGRTSYYDNKPHSASAPPPPRVEVQPPRPSVHAEWVAGYWQREADWIWSPGFWRVPAADIQAEQTVEAPSPPPPPKQEAPVVQAVASAKLVWTAGYWAWNGSAYIWIEGAWRLPPEGAVWVAPAWTPRRGRVVLQPGGWSISVHVR